MCNFIKIRKARQNIDEGALRMRAGVPTGSMAKIDLPDDFF